MSLYPPQIAGIAPVLNPTRRYILNWEMGCGKSVGTCEFMNQHRTPPKTLVVCPAMVRLDWEKAFTKFYQYKTHIGIHRFGFRKNLTKAQTEELFLAHRASVQIVSADLVGEITSIDFELIVLDEIHIYKNAKAVRSQQVRELLAKNPQAFVLGLTGTLAPNDLGDIHNPIDLLWPGRFGNKYAFQHRYQNKTLKVINEQTGETRAKFVGIREEHAEELAYRLSALSTRVTRKDVAQYLPAFDINLLRIEVEKFDWKLGRDAKSIEGALEYAANAKLMHVVAWVVNAKETTSHVAVLTHHKAVADAYVRALQAKLPLEKIVHVDGDIPVDKRLALIDGAKASDSAILVGTIQSLGLGISLTKFSQAICAEFHWSPGVMEQLLLRFSRLDSMVPSAMWFAMVPGTIDEIIATRLEEKFKAINPIAETGLVGSKLEGLLQLDDATFLAGITEAAMALDEDEYHL